MSKKIGLLLIGYSCFAYASHMSDCIKGKGVYLSGTIVSDNPTFRSGKAIHGIELSHTHISINAYDSKVYDVAIDNVFANDYNKSETIPRSLTTLAKGKKVELCGSLYTPPALGIHWVHSNCGDVPTSGAPNGFVYLINDDGSTSQNLEASENYCYLWNHL